MKKLFTITILALSISALAQNPEGGSLSANPTAQPENVCAGQQVHLLPYATGGSCEYSFTWTSDPPGFTSISPEPYVTPETTTTYTVEVNDGISTTTATVTVNVLPSPIIDLISENDTNLRVIGTSEISVCAFKSVELDAGNPGCTYLWSNGSTEQKVSVGTSGISYDVQEHHVIVTNPSIGCSSDTTIIVHFSFTDCSYGIDGSDLKEKIQIFPNPSSTGIFYCLVEGLGNALSLEVYTSQGNLVDRIVYHSYTAGVLRSTINISYLKSGVYFLRLSNEQYITTKKLIIQ